MKTLYVVRHAKSSWEDMSLSDHDRPLLPIGVKKTKRIISFLKSRQIKPELLLSSSAVRAFETARLIAEGIEYPAENIKAEPNLYHASSRSIFKELYGLDNQINTVMIFGHNPTFTYFVNNFLDIPIDNLPTSGLVGIRFETDKWENIDDAKFTVEFIVTPKMLKKD
jgi:phosphohistidine phosphatase